MTLVIVGCVLIVISLAMCWYGRGGEDAKVDAFKVNVSGKSWLIVLLAGCAMITAQWWRDAEHADNAAPPPPTEVLTDTFDYDRLSTLWDDCGGGNNASCDTLWIESPIDSDWETYGSTCAERSETPLEGECVDTLDATPTTGS